MALMMLAIKSWNAMLWANTPEDIKGDIANPSSSGDSTSDITKRLQAEAVLLMKEAKIALAEKKEHVASAEQSSE